MLFHVLRDNAQLVPCVALSVFEFHHVQFINYINRSINVIAFNMLFTPNIGGNRQRPSGEAVQVQRGDVCRQVSKF